MHGTATSEVEVTNISSYGIWVLVDDKEYFLPYEEFPWFKNVTIAKIFNVERQSGNHLYWPDLDVDLGLDSMEHPERFPLKAKWNN